MIVFREAAEVTHWLVAFHPDCAYRWARLVPGRFKHVSAFAFAESARMWVFYDVSIGRTKLFLLPAGRAADERIATWVEGCSILKAQARETGRNRPRLMFSCVSAVAHLLGLRTGALRPDALWADLLRSGAEIVFDGSSNGVEPCVAGRGDRGIECAAAGVERPAADGPAAAGG